MLATDDESSRDSGICLMEEGSPTCFTAMHSAQGSSRMEVDQDENATDAKSPPGKQNKILLRREKSSCQVRLFDESPTSHIQFLRPALTLRPSNHDPLNRHQDQRKRTLGIEDGDWVINKLEKRHKVGHASEHHHLEPTERNERSDMDQTVEAAQARQSKSKATKRLLFSRHHSTAAIMQHDRDKDAEDGSHLVVHYHLNTIPAMCSTSYRRITCETLCDLMVAISENEFREKYILIDCRYPYEYNGGHIKSAINFFDRDKVSTLFFDEDGNRRFKKIPIFYCEFSQKRGPSMAYALREDDRQRNFANYPNCSYEEMYVLDKGFRDFYNYASKIERLWLCEPIGYIEMSDPLFAHELKTWNFHRRATVGQTALRLESQENHRTSSSSSTALRSYRSWSSSTTFQTSMSSLKETSEEKENSTPASRRDTNPFRRNLFKDATNSPTNFSRPMNLQKRESVTPPPEEGPLPNLQFS